MQRFEYTQCIEPGRLARRLSYAGVNVPLPEVIFLDIETTGFSARNSCIYLIGLAVIEDDMCRCIQLFADTPDDEADVIAAAMDILSGYSVVITYNGESFDIPFIRERARRVGVRLNKKSITDDIRTKNAVSNDLEVIDSAMNDNCLPISNIISIDCMATKSNNVDSNLENRPDNNSENKSENKSRTKSEIDLETDSETDSKKIFSTKLESVDLYKIMRRINRLLGLPGIKQKDVERFLGIGREDKFTGGELIKVYREYIVQYKLGQDTHALLTELLTHNREDVCAMPAICAVFTYNCLNHMDDTSLFKYESCELSSEINELNRISSSEYRDSIHELLDESQNKTSSLADIDKENTIVKYIHLTFRFNAAFPVPVNLQTDGGIRIKLSGSQVKFIILVTEGTLKHFYSDYKNYYYIPAEDMAIHKSVSSYMDASARQKATRDKCYTKKAGIFVPVFGTCEHPCFKQSYNDKQSYIQYSEELFVDEKFATLYASSITSSI